VLAAHASLLSFTTETTKDPEGQRPPRSPNWNTQGRVLGPFRAELRLLHRRLPEAERRAAGKPGCVDTPLAFVAWTISQRVTAFDAVWPDTGEATRNLIVVLAAIALGMVATVLPFAADKAPAKEVGPG
jgi:hypothetical protein